MISTDLTSVSTHGWYTDESAYDRDALTAVSTFGWYGISLEELIDQFNQQLGFGLTIDQIFEKQFEITRIKGIELKR